MRVGSLLERLNGKSQERKGYEIYQDLRKLSQEPKLRLLEVERDYMTVEVKQAISHELIEI